MRTLLLFFCLLISNLVCAANPAAASFATLDSFFVNKYSAENKIIGAKLKPILVVNDFNYELHFSENNVKKFNGLINPFNELKAVSHLGPCLYAVGSPSWRDQNSTSWKPQLQELLLLVTATKNEVKKIDWSNPAWPGKEKALQQFMFDSLTMAENFINSALKKNSFTLQDYQTFSRHYMHTMVTTMYLADLANTHAVIKQLTAWKQELGPRWDDLFVVIMGSKGRLTSELTLATNTAAITVSSLMKPDLAKKNIIIMPNAPDFNRAIASLGAIVNARQLAAATFTTERAKDVSGLYKAMLTSTVPLAKDNVQHIVNQNLLQGQITLPILGILPKDKEFFSNSSTPN